MEIKFLNKLLNLIKNLKNNKFTGKLSLNFHKGDLSNEIEQTERFSI